MKLKLTAAQFKALYGLFTWIREKWQPATMEARLLKALLEPIEKKMYFRAFDKKAIYRLPLTDQEALTFYCFFQHFPMPENMVFETVLVQTIKNNIHQQFAT